jgi:hypothetical protein
MIIYQPDVLRHCRQGKMCVHSNGPWLPATAEYFRVRRNRGQRSRLNGICRECEKESRRLERQKPEVRAYRRAYMRGYQEAPKRKAYVRTHAQDPVRKAYIKSYHQTPKRKAYERAYRQSPEGQAKIKAKGQRRRKRERSLFVAFTSADWQCALDYFDNRCAVCGRLPDSQHVLVADHWIPVFNPDCPGTIPTNIVPLCHGEGGCNNSKSDRNAREWLIERFGLEEAEQTNARIEAYFDKLRDK